MPMMSPVRSNRILEMLNHISRRAFLKTAAITGATLGFSGTLPRLVKSALAQPQGPIDLAVVKGSPEAAVRKAVALMGGISRFVKPGDKVVLKPNASFANTPDWGSTTTPEVLTAVAKLCLEAGASRVLVMDYPLRASESCRERTGLGKACEALGSKVSFVLIDKGRFFSEVSVPNGKAIQKAAIARELLTPHVLINIPVAKTHSATGISFGMKNLMGLIWGRGAFHESSDLNQAIADLSTVIKPKLTIMDATRALTTNGPGGPGRTIKLNTIVAGTDPVAVDSYATTLAPWYGRMFTGRQVKHILAASQMGLGQIDLGKLHIEKVSV